MRINTDSPWFWLSLFVVAALVGLALIGSKHLQREERRARMQGAREMRQQPESQAPRGETREPGDPAALRRPSATILPLAVFLVVVLVLGALAARWSSRRGQVSAGGPDP